MTNRFEARAAAAKKAQETIKVPVVTEQEKRTQPKKQKSTAGKKVAARKIVGRPKGEPARTRSLRIKVAIDDRFIAKQKETGLSFNELANRALDAYLK